MKKLLLLLVSAFASVSLMAQTTSVVVKLTRPDGSPATDVNVQARKAKSTSVTNSDGVAHVDVAIKDELIITSSAFYEVSVAVKNWNPADTLAVPMTPVVTSGESGVEGIEAFNADNLGKYSKFGDIYGAIKGEYPLLRVFGNCVVSNRSTDDNECAFIVVDGKPNDNLEAISLSEVSSIEFLQPNQAAIYGTRAKYGALVITTVGNTTKQLHK